jgi:F-type H+-transporting ATPase subunit b
VQIDWLTVAAQIVNFLVLVWLLQRFLYRPITEAMRRREAKIEQRLSEAKDARAEAEREAGRLDSERAELEARKDDVLSEAREEADELRDRLEAELREEMEEKRAAWARHLAEERDAFARTLQRRAGQQVLDIAARVLDEFADADLSERVAGTFLARLDALDDDTRDKLADAAAESETAMVETGTALDSAARGRVTRGLHEALSSELEVEYREDPEVLLGVRLTIGEQSVEWSAAHHLRRLESTLDEVLETARAGGPGGEAGAGEAAGAQETSPA